MTIAGRARVSPSPLDAARLLAVDKIAVVITVEKESGRIAHIAANLMQPMRVLLGLARITDLDIDLSIEPMEQSPSHESADVQSGSTARITMSKLGSPVEYSWSDFRRVASYQTEKKREP